MLCQQPISRCCNPICSRSLPFRHRLQHAHRRIATVFFIESGLGSVVATGDGHRWQAEVGVMGREGMTGVAVVLGAEHSPYEIFMQIEGSGQSIDARHLSNRWIEAAPWLAASSASHMCSRCKQAIPRSLTPRVSSRSVWHAGC